MDENSIMKSEDIFRKVETQFLCCYPVNNIDWQNLSDLTWDEQKIILERTCLHDLNRKYPINVQYQLNFLKRLIIELEQNTCEVLDAIYETYCSLEPAVEEKVKFSYKHYSLPKYGTVISLRESTSFVAEGTTGLCSWQASLALSDFLLHHDEVVRGKSVIELGSGTGLCGFIVSKCCNPDSITLTDGSPVVIEVLNINRNINFPNEEEAEDRLSIVHLPWDANELIQAKKYDVILAADVVYDETEFENLLSAIDHLFQLSEDQVQLVLAATVRNEETLKSFLDLLESKGFSIRDEDVVPVEDSYLLWDRSTTVRIMTITRKSK